MSLVTRDAEIIASKLDAQIEDRKRHRLAKIFYRGRYIAAFGIRRGSAPNLGHGHIPKELGLTPAQAAELAACTMCAADFFALKGPPQP